MLGIVAVAGTLLGMVLLLVWWAYSRTSKEKTKAGRGIAWIICAIGLGGALLFWIIFLFGLLTPHRY